MPLHKRNLILLYFTLAVILLGFGVLIPLEAFLVEKFGASGQALGALLSLHALCQLLFSPIWGSISDSVGRKPILMVGAIGNAAALVMFGLSTHLWMLFVARALSGTFAAATMPTALAYIGDSTSEEDRGGGMGVIGAAFGTGMVLGPGIGGWLGANSLSLPFYVTGVLSLLAAVLVFFILPESLPVEKRQKTVRVDVVSRFPAMWSGLKGPLSVFFLLSWMVSFGLSNLEGIMGLFALERFGFGPSQVGVIMVVVGTSIAAVQMALTGPATRRWGERTVIKGTLLASAITFLIILLAYNFITLLVTTGMFALSNAMLRPSISSLVSKEAKIDQGLALGLNSSFMSLGRFTGPLLAGFLIDVHLNLPYIAGSVIMFLGFIYVMYSFQKPRETLSKVPQQ
jgi:DHA1 family multidrug resistance protein-like MFS transporter